MIGVNYLRGESFTSNELLGFNMLGLKVNNFLIHRGELCRVRFSKQFQLDVYSDQDSETQQEWLEELGIKL